MRAEEETAEMREKHLMRGREFEGHSPPKAPTLDLGTIETLVVKDPETRYHLSELWPKAYDALEEILDDPEASSASKVQAAKIVQAARASQQDLERAAMVQRIEFVTAAYTPRAD